MKLTLKQKLTRRNCAVSEARRIARAVNLSIENKMFWVGYWARRANKWHPMSDLQISGLVNLCGTGWIERAEL